MYVGLHIGWYFCFTLKKTNTVLMAKSIVIPNVLLYPYNKVLSYTWIEYKKNTKHNLINKNYNFQQYTIIRPRHW